MGWRRAVKTIAKHSHGEGVSQNGTDIPRIFLYYIYRQTYDNFFLVDNILRGFMALKTLLKEVYVMTR